ncbi:MAG: serine/threonine-protein kinase, partial [Planctomycetota bacterium]|nr:serine/threonine-protein kinase [Planctomycetota bacterium]
MIHRDLKPGNILLDAKREPRVGDFGLASVAGNPALSRTGDFQGTLAYMSPEQAASRRMGLDEKTDIFSLGASLYEALAGVRPFEGDSPQQIVRKILQEEPSDPRRYRSRIPRDLAVICLRALEKRPENRFATMSEFAADLRRYLGGESIRSVPPGWPVRAMRWCRRHPWPTAAASLTLVGLGSVSALWAQNRAAWKESERSLVITERVLGLTSELLEGLDPNSSNRPMASDGELSGRMREAERMASDELADRPLMAADLREALARVYLGHTQFEEGARLLEQAHATRARELGAAHPKTLGAALLWGEALAGAGLGYEGFVILERSAELASASVGPDAPLTVDLVTRAYTVIYTYALTSHLTGFWDRWGSGEEVLKRRLAELRLERGQGDAQTLKVQRALSYVLNRRGIFEESEELLIEGLAAGRQSLGSQHLVTISLAESLELVQARARGDWLVHRDELARLWKLRVELQGSSHPKTLGARLAMGWLSLEGGELELGESIYRELLEPVARSWGEYSRKSLLLRMHLAVLVKRSGRLEEAEEMFVPLIEDFVVAPNVGRKAPLTCNTVRALVEVYVLQERYEESRELLQENLDILFAE